MWTHATRCLCDFKCGSLSRYVTTFHDLWSLVIGISYLIYHVASWDHVFEGSNDILGGSYSLYVITMPSLVAMGNIVKEIYFNLSPKTTWSRRHVGFWSLWLGFLWSKLTLTTFVVHRDFCCGDMIFHVVEGQGSTCFRLIQLLLFISKAHAVSCSYTRNFKIKSKMTKTFANVQTIYLPWIITNE